MGFEEDLLDYSYEANKDPFEDEKERRELLSLEMALDGDYDEEEIEDVFLPRDFGDEADKLLEIEVANGNFNLDAVEDTPF